ncbi:proton-coupled amino acid transporter-like protein pathetic isoform X2 [Coccinella septempunctata]|uniref:proton-coupled amino acid transporter-like protein pathetic isoform X2 n=2 Tax=Coccinella septempunctata TaxID=41139 RepID=UPI001D09763A|nr:proton-coupled amino acid transporter-like protein pathetic isoform X2 [Coccinella septempunctata]
MSHKNQATVPLHGAFKPQLIVQVDKKKGGVNTVVMNNYKSEKNDVPVQSGNGSTVPLVVGTKRDEELGTYNPADHRDLKHPTSDWDTLIHLLKGSLGSGILSMPLAFAHAGLAMGLACTLLVGIICTYCVHILVKSAHILYRRNRVPALGFAELAHASFLAGPPSYHQWAQFAKSMINFFLVVDLLGCCCVYIGFVASNLKQVIDFNTGTDYDVRLYMAALLPILIAVNLIRNLKYLAPFSMLANLFIGAGMAITYYYLIQDLPSIESAPLVVEVKQLPMFFGTAIFALEGIGVVMPLENNMKNPDHFIGCPGVLNIGMAFVVALYSVTGFLGFLKYGPDTMSSISLNLPQEQPLAQAVKLMIALAIFFTYSLQFYVPMQIIWKNVKSKFTSRPNLSEYTIRISLIILTVVLAIVVPNLSGFISLVGAVCLSMLGMIFPAIIETLTCYEEPGFGKFSWRLYKNIFLIIFGLVGFLTGSYVSLQEIFSSQ